MGRQINEHASSLAYEWRRLTRAATAVALLTAPAFFVLLYQSDNLSLVWSLLITLAAVVASTVRNRSRSPARSSSTTRTDVRTTSNPIPGGTCAGTPGSAG